jgi:hypothetical protein
MHRVVTGKFPYPCACCSLVILQATALIKEEAQLAALEVHGELGVQSRLELKVLHGAARHKAEQIRPPQEPLARAGEGVVVAVGAWIRASFSQI